MNDRTDVCVIKFKRMDQRAIDHGRGARLCTSTAKKAGGSVGNLMCQSPILSHRGGGNSDAQGVEKMQTRRSHNRLRHTIMRRAGDEIGNYT